MLRSRKNLSLRCRYRSIQVDTAADAYSKVVREAGCSLHRDAVDTSLIDQLKSLGKQGKIIENTDEIGGTGEIQGGDTPGEIKALKEVGPVNKAGYTELEVYLNSLAAAPDGHPGLR